MRFRFIWAVASRTGCARVHRVPGRSDPRLEVWCVRRARSEGRIEARTWRADDGTASSGALLDVVVHRINEARRDIALAITISQSTEAQTRAYAASHLPDVGTLMTVALPTRPGQQSVAGGGMPQRSLSRLRTWSAVSKQPTPTPSFTSSRLARTACCSSSVSSIKESRRASFTSSTFDRRGSKTYQPSFVID